MIVNLKLVVIGYRWNPLCVPRPEFPIRVTIVLQVRRLLNVKESLLRIDGGLICTRAEVCPLPSDRILSSLLHFQV